MTKTSLLQIDELAPTQTGKSITVNAALAALEQAGNAVFENLSAGGTDITISEANFLRHAIFVFDGASANIEIEFPDEVGSPPGDTERVFAVHNLDTNNTLTIRGVGSGTTVALAPGTIGLFYKQAIDVVAISIVSSLTNTFPYDFGMFIPGTPTALAVMARIVVGRPFTLPVNLAGSYAVVGTNPTATETFTLNKNGSAFGTLQIDNAGADTFTAASATSFVAGDIITVVAPTPAPDHVDLSITLVGTRTG